MTPSPSLTAVDSFTELHEQHGLPSNERYYRDLIPLSQPGPGEQYAFEVDLDACTGCKSCVVACHSLNGLDDDESWRSVGTLQGGAKVAFQQTVTTACHHCVEPACLTGCPVNAYEKDDVTGIVSHLDDQCIGCSYCTLTCPYEVPRFNEARGIVRKCDMCRGRLEVGEAPACVQSCPNGAIRVSIVSKADAVAAAVTVVGAALVPGAPASAITVPTTRYRTARSLPEVTIAVDHLSLRPAHPHPPLAAMLVLTQLAVGALAADLLLRTAVIDGLSPGVRPIHAAVAAVAAVVAVAASTFHLGRPRYAFRAVLGFSHSWLSREVVAFGALALLAPAYAVAAWTAPTSAATAWIGAAGLAAGLAGVGCSVMLYAVTRRMWWQARRTAPLFLLSGVATGLVATMATTAVVAHFDEDFSAAAVDQIRLLGLAVATVAAVKLVVEIAAFRHLHDASLGDLRRSVILLRRDLWASVQSRLFLGATGGVVLPLVLSAGASPSAVGPGAVAAVVAALLLIAGELLERHHFFRVAVAPRMPGDLH